MGRLRKLIAGLRNVTLSKVALIAAAGVAVFAGGAAVGAAVDDPSSAGRFVQADERETGPGFRDGPAFRDGPPPGFSRGRGRKLGHWRKLGLLDPDLREVLRDIMQAIARETPEIAEPIIDDAEKDGKISSEQADRLRERIERIGEGRLPFGRGGPPRDEPGP